MTRLLTIPLLAIAMLWAPATSLATKVVPPGVSGANQYSETLPGPGGNTKAGDLGQEGGRSRTPAQALGAENARDLEELGPEGRQAAELAAETTPRKSAAHRRQAAGATSSGGDSGLDQVLGQVTGTGGSNAGGMEWLLPLLIGASILSAAAYVLSKRHSAGAQD